LKNIRFALLQFAPHAFIPHRQTRSSQAPSPPMVHRGSPYFTTPPGIPPDSSRSQVYQYFQHARRLRRRISPET